MGLLGGRLLSRAAFYEQLAQMLEAGLSIRAALEIEAGGRSPFARAARGLDERIAGGATFAGAMAAAGPVFGAFERHAAEAGERAGKLPETLRSLAGYFALRGAALDRMGFRLLYPVFLLHAAVLLPNLGVLVGTGASAYVRRVAPPILGLWAAAALAIFAWRAARRGDGGRRATDGALLALPLAGGAVRSLALAEYAHALGVLYEAGVPILEALERAADATRNAAVAAAGRRVAEDVRGGAKIAEALAREPRAFPREFAEAVQVGEASGKLDRTLERSAAVARERAERAVNAAAAGLPVLIYIAAAGYVAYTVVSFWTNLYGEAQKGF
jgi:type II secretory pathway component PulF